ncbi:MAG: TetR/AcrR family transcriptional regulator [Actinobacteria bacterium]|nr:TetR/AcrR family transcriptional regulator [Actinomycetota bacterium]
MPPNPPVARRAKSARSLANSVKVLDAVRKNATKVGLDELSAGSVAKLCGLSTGSIYSRFEDADEMAIALWEQVIKQPFKQRLQRGVDYIYTPNSSRLVIDEEATFKADFETPDELSKLGVEFLVVAKRNNAIGEVVIPEVSAWFNEFGLNQANTERNNAAIALGLSASIGTAMRAFVLGSNSDWLAIARGIRDAVTAARRAAPLTRPPDLPLPKLFEIETGNPVRDALIIAVGQVVATSGYSRATISRIVRKSGLSNGSLYNLYANKEELTDDAMQMTLAYASGVNREGNRIAESQHRADRGLGNSFALGLMPGRRQWLDFRLECLIASRNHSPTRTKFKESLISSRDALASSMPDIPREIVNLLSSGEQAIGLGFTALDLFTRQLPRCDFYSIMAKLSEQNRLLLPNS